MNEAMVNLADEYQRGLDKMLASGYEEYEQAIENHKLVIAALRASAAAAPAASDYDPAFVKSILDADAAPPEGYINNIDDLAPPAASRGVRDFQPRVLPWLLECFGPVIPFDKQERNHRFLEEALELVQACGCTQSEAHQLVDYVYGRDQGDRYQEAGGVMVTLAALCIANGFDMHAAGETELARIWTKVETIRAKQAAKPKHSPLPAAVTAPPLPSDGVRERLRSVLKEHWITSVNCDKQESMNHASCSCSLLVGHRVPSVGAAVDEWIEHVLATLASPHEQVR